MDVRQDELGDLVDKEMAATSAAIEEAVRRIDVSIVNLSLRCLVLILSVMNRHLIFYSLSTVTDKCLIWFCIQEMMNQARKDTSGVKLEVNERFVLLLVPYLNQLNTVSVFVACHLFC